jgi:hypothetical protein
VLLPFDPFIRFRVFGVRLATRFSTLLVLVLVLGGVLARLDDGNAAPTRGLSLALQAAVCSALVVAALILHELVRLHAARRLGVVVRRTEFALYGGSHEVVDDSTSPRAEALTGAAGFLLFAAVAGLAVALDFGTRGLAAEIHRPMRVLALALSLLALAQLAPSLPFDGGRVIRGLFWYLFDDALAGTRAASFFAQAQMAALTATGIVLLGAGGTLPFWGAAAIVAGVQLSAAARATVHRSLWQRLSRPISLSAAVEAFTPAVSEDTPLDDIIERLLTHGVESPLLVLSGGGKPVGVIRSANLRGVRRSEWGERVAAEIMTRLDTLPRLPGSMSVFEAVSTMDDNDHRIALVETDDRLRPVTREQLIRRLFERKRASEDAGR